MGEVRLYVVDDEYVYSASEIICCRICHEAEFESSRNLESPCSCSGTVKFAHRDCIQRWCNEKGNTICEICLQKFEPGYSAPPPPPKKAQLVDDIGVTIQGSLEVRRREESFPPETVEEEETEYAECSSAADASASLCRTLALIFTVLLLVRHMLAVFITGTGDYPFTLVTLMVIRASGILFPMYIIMRMIDTIHNSITRRHQEAENDRLSSVEGHDIGTQQHRIDIH